MKKILLFLAAAIFFAGCLNYYQEVKLYTDGSGKMKIEYWMPMPDVGSSKILDKIGIFNPDSIRNEFGSPYSKIENVAVFADTTDSTTHALIRLSFNNIDSLDRTKAFADYHFSLIDGAAGQKIFSQFIPPIATGFGIDGSNFHVEYKYIIPGDIITHNATQKKGNTLIWRYSLSEIGNGKTISVTFRPFKLKETPSWIYYLSGFVLLIVIIFLFKKKKD